MTTLKLDWCSYEAAKYAVEHWHYSKTMPAGKLAKIGVWEDGRYVGCVLFGRGAASNIASPYGLEQTQICELVRIALDKHTTPVSRIIAIAVRQLRRAQPGLRLIVSFADSNQGHHGGIYQAGGWYYTGASRDRATRVHGQLFHPKTLHSRYGYGGQSIPWLREHVDPNAENVMLPPKLKYCMPLDDAMRKQIAPLAKPYPKRVTRGSGETDNAPQPNEETGGASPTEPLLLT
jgi:hypothetical protein